jgi:peptidoglycan/LPS O-acetylase OafA/YrhL
MASAMEGTTERDDHVLPAMRVAAVVVVAVLVPALIILWGLPTRTDDLWAWTIAAPLTPIFMGAGYGAGAYFFLRVYRTRRWHEVSVGVLSAAVFALLMLITTLVHFDKFNQGKAHDGLPDPPVLATVAYYGWTIVYILSPWVVGWLWWRNQRRDPRVPEDGEPLVPADVRVAARVIAIGALIGAAAMLFSPGTVIDNWGWGFTELTARVLGCFTAQVGTGFLLLSFDPRWSSWKVLVQTFLIAVALLLVGAIREWDTFLEDRPMQWAYLAGLVGGAVALLALYRSMERSRAHAEP